MPELAGNGSHPDAASWCSATTRGETATDVGIIGEAEPPVLDADRGLHSTKPRCAVVMGQAPRNGRLATAPVFPGDHRSHHRGSQSRFGEVALVRGATAEEVARKAGISPAGLATTVEKYGRGEDAFGKHSDLVAP